MPYKKQIKTVLLWGNIQREELLAVEFARDTIFREAVL